MSRAGLAAQERLRRLDGSGDEAERRAERTEPGAVQGQMRETSKTLEHIVYFNTNWPQHTASFIC